MRHQQFGFPDELAVLLPFDGSHRNGTAFVNVEAIGLPSVHLGVGRAIAHQGALADLGVDAARDEESNVDVRILQFQRLIEAEQGVLGSTIGRAQGESKQSR